jgi:leucyl aminopeptidase
MDIKCVDKIETKDFSGIVLPYFEDDQMDYEEIIASENGPEMEYLKEKEIFSGKTNELFHYSLPKGKQIQEIIYVGLGKKEDVTIDLVRGIIAKAFKAIKAKKVDQVIFNLNCLSNVIQEYNALGRAVAESIIMSNYTFDKYKTKDKKEYLENIIIVFEHLDDAFIRGAEEGIYLGEVNIFTRKVVNDPANVVTPESLAQTAIDEGKDCFDVEVFGLEKIKTLKMEAFLSVAKGSEHEPKLIVMRYRGNPDGETWGYIGKGLTYDSGGLSIKPTNSMLEMKSDMGGAAAVIGAMKAISKMKLNVNITAVVATCENMISGNSYKPGDIITAMSGKTIFIGNTDAEGRLTLADAIHYAIEYEKVDKIVDIATLTGAAIHCLGVEMTPVLSNDDKLFEKLQIAATQCDEKIWRLPIIDEYKELLKHDYADMTNSPGSPGTITAGIFLSEFVQELPWLHLDIAGTSFLQKPKKYYSKGATGEGARLLYNLAKNAQ